MLRNLLLLATSTRMRLGGRSIPILTAVLTLGVACVTAPDERIDRAPRTRSSGRSVATMSADAELSLLGSLWFETPPVTITYRTTDRPPGGPTSAHQCLRQMAGFSSDRQELLATCN
jgi:predicted lysophospholipase L1 biosynthesis ABC-type transport system permease subunit